MQVDDTMFKTNISLGFMFASNGLSYFVSSYMGSIVSVELRNINTNEAFENVQRRRWKIRY